MATILIVEDEQPIRQLLIISLTPEHRVVQATDVPEAIELARLTHPDLVLLDLNLKGGWDGLEVCRTLRSEPDPVLAQVPIVVLTANTGRADIKAALNAGVNSFVGKPYEPSSLLALIDTLLTRRAI
jgi:two-component system alkaline phosphatase synthesis response regulator PhoP